MSCYFRHLNTLFAEAGIEVTPANREEIDRAFHEIMGETYKECPATWRKLKLELADEVKRKELVSKLKKAIR
jgi:hypothetical protein